MHPAPLVLGAGKQLIERVSKAERAVAHRKIRCDVQRPRLLTSTSSSRQLWALSRTPVWKPSSSFLPSGVAPISTSMHSAWSSIRACR
jgi:hypothetical protein